MASLEAAYSAISELDTLSAQHRSLTESVAVSSAAVQDVNKRIVAAGDALRAGVTDYRGIYNAIVPALVHVGHDGTAPVSAVDRTLHLGAECIAAADEFLERVTPVTHDMKKTVEDAAAAATKLADGAAAAGHLVHDIAAAAKRLEEAELAKAAASKLIEELQPQVTCVAAAVAALRMRNDDARDRVSQAEYKARVEHEQMERSRSLEMHMTQRHDKEAAALKAAQITSAQRAAERAAVMAAARERLAAVKAAVNEAQGKLAERSEQVKASKEEVVALDGDLAATKQELDTKVASNDKLSAEVLRMQADHDGLQADVAAEDAKLRSTVMRFGTSDRLVGKLRVATEENSALAAVLEAARQEVVLHQAQVEALAARERDLKADVDAIGQQLGELQAAVSRVRSRVVHIPLGKLRSDVAALDSSVLTLEADAGAIAAHVAAGAAAAVHTAEAAARVQVLEAAVGEMSVEAAESDAKLAAARVESDAMEQLLLQASMEVTTAQQHAKQRIAEAELQAEARAGEATTALQARHARAQEAHAAAVQQLQQQQAELMESAAALAAVEAKLLDADVITKGVTAQSSSRTGTSSGGKTVSATGGQAGTGFGEKLVSVNKGAATSAAAVAARLTAAAPAAPSTVKDAGRSKSAAKARR